MCCPAIFVLGIAYLHRMVKRKPTINNTIHIAATIAAVTAWWQSTIATTNQAVCLAVSEMDDEKKQENRVDIGVMGLYQRKKTLFGVGLVPREMP